MGEPFGTLVLALSVTVIEGSLVLSMMFGSVDADPLWFATRSMRR